MARSTHSSTSNSRYGNRGRGAKSSESTDSRTGPRPSFKLDGQEEVTFSAVEPQARNPERVNVFVEGRYAFSINSMLALELGLRAGQTLSTDTLRDVLQRDEVTKAVEACVRLLGYRPRTEAELLKRLAGKGYDSALAAEAVERVRAMGYVDDAEFARFWVQNREQFKPMGARRLRYELLQKGVDRETAQQVIEDTLPEQEDDNAMRVARSKLRALAGADYPTFRRRLGGFLSRQGYDWETSSRVIKQLWSETQTHEEIEED